MKMQLLEFLEGVARCCDILSLGPPGFNDDEWPMTKRVAQPLANKIEYFLYVFIKLSKKEFIGRYKWPGRDEWGLFVVARIIISS